MGLLWMGSNLSNFLNSNNQTKTVLKGGVLWIRIKEVIVFVPEGKLVCRIRIL